MDATYNFQGISFVWNVQKARVNQTKHGVSFKHACEAFFDPFFCIVDASQQEETRDAIIGEDATGHLLFVVHIQQIGDIFRIVSARKATKSERKIYEDQ
ncbi:MAG: BrnT family toxin [Magnetococcales bacterium]|nr:BrnT family toxin [Magnetococcales bacterium]